MAKNIRQSNLHALKRAVVAGADKVRTFGVGGIKLVNNIKEDSPEIIGICNPHYSGGVLTSTYALAKNVLEVSDIHSGGQIKKIAKIITSYSPKKVLISGHSIGYDRLAQEIKKQNPDIEIYAYIHSAFIWFDQYPRENYVFDNILQLQKKGVIKRIGFCKKDLAEYFGTFGYDTCLVMNRFYLDRKEHKLGKPIKIGVWGKNLWHRNILNQVIAALMIPDAEVHVNEVGDQTFLDHSRVYIHGFLPKAEFNKVFSEMDINMYVGFTDCFPMTLIESMACEIPCIASDTSEVYAGSKYLSEQLIVSAVDSPIKISEKIFSVLKNYDNIQKEIKEYFPLLTREVEKSIKEFLD